MKKLTIGTAVPNPVKLDLDVIDDWANKSAQGFAQQAHTAWALIKEMADEPGAFELFIPRSFKLEPVDGYVDPRPDQPVVFATGQLQQLTELLAAAAEGTDLELKPRSKQSLALLAEIGGRGLGFTVTDIRIEHAGASIGFTSAAAPAIAEDTFAGARPKGV